MSGQLLILWSALILVVGIVAIVVAALGARRTGDQHRTAYLVFLTTFSLSVLLYLIRLYVAENLGDLSVTFQAVWGSLDGFFDLAVIVTALLFFHELYGISYARAFVIPLLAVSFAVYVLFLVSGLRSIASGAASLPIGLIIPLAYYYLLFGYVILLNVLRLASLRGGRNRFFGWGLFCFLLVGAVESVLSIPSLAGGAFVELIAPRRLYISIVPYLGWSIASTIVLWGADHATPAAPSLDSFCAQYGISPREREILAAISRGWSNKEIAERLFISLQTVKTHAHHLYEKTGTNSRTALLASIQSLE